MFSLKTWQLSSSVSFPSCFFPLIMKYVCVFAFVDYVIIVSTIDNNNINNNDKCSFLYLFSMSLCMYVSCLDVTQYKHPFPEGRLYTA